MKQTKNDKNFDIDHNQTKMSFMTYTQDMAQKQRDTMCKLLLDSETTDLTFVFKHKEHDTDSSDKISVNTKHVDSIDPDDSKIEDKVSGKRCNVHRALIAAISPILKVMLYDSKWSESRQKEIILQDKLETFDAFKSIVNYAYCNNPQISLQNVFGVRYLCEKYQIKQLANDCDTFVIEQLSMKNFFQLMKMADKYTLTQLMNQMVKNVGNKSKLEEEIFQFLKSPQLLQMSIDHLQVIVEVLLSSSKKSGQIQESIWMVLNKWFDQKEQSSVAGINDEQDEKKQDTAGVTVNLSVTQEKAQFLSKVQHHFDFIQMSIPFVAQHVMNIDGLKRKIFCVERFNYADEEKMWNMIVKWIEISDINECKDKLKCLSNFKKYFDFSLMSKEYFIKNILTIDGLLTSQEIASVLQKWQYIQYKMAHIPKYDDNRNTSDNSRDRELIKKHKFSSICVYRFNRFDGDVLQNEQTHKLHISVNMNAYFDGIGVFCGKGLTTAKVALYGESIENNKRRYKWRQLATSNQHQFKSNGKAFHPQKLLFIKPALLQRNKCYIIQLYQNGPNSVRGYDDTQSYKDNYHMRRRDDSTSTFGIGKLIIQTANKCDSLLHRYGQGDVDNTIFEETGQIPCLYFRV